MADDKEDSESTTSEEKVETEDKSTVTADAEAHGENPDKEEDGKKEPMTVPLAKHLSYKEKWNKKIDDADQRAENSARETERLRLENELLKKQSGAFAAQKKEGIPLEVDFDTTEAYQAAFQEYLRSENEKNMQAWSDKQAQSTLSATQETKLDEAMQSHLTRAVNLGVDDYDEVEDKARAILTDDVCKEIMQRFDNSEQILYSLGKNPSKAHEIIQTLRADPTQGVVDLTNIARNFTESQTTGSSLPEPDTSFSGGQAPTNVIDFDQQIDEMRQKVSDKKATMNDLLKLKAKAKASGYVERRVVA